MFVSAQITAELTDSALLVPDSAVLRSGQKNTVFLVLNDGQFAARTVVLGAEAENGMVQVLSGLNEGDRVVSSGQFMLDSESQLNEAIQKMRGAGNGTEAHSVLTTNPIAKTLVAKSDEPAVYVCPMPDHVSITYDHPGNCPICNMAFVPVTASDLKKLQPGGKVLYYTCPMPEHASVHQDKSGKCPICAMTLIPVMEAPKPAAAAQTNAVAQAPLPTLYTCGMHPEVVFDKPGTCPICKMELRLTSELSNGKIAEQKWREMHAH
jgi:rubrerythrin